MRPPGRAPAAVALLQMRFHTRVTRFFRELKRRKVFHVGSAYLMIAWGASLGAAELLPAFGVSDWGVRLFVVVAVLGFPVAVCLAWMYEISAEGIQVDPADQPVASRRQAATTRFAGRGASIRVTWDGADGRQQRSFANSFVIGRDPACELHLDDEMVSRRHARVFVERGVWHVEDLGSRNGTRLNGDLITRAELPEDARLLLYPDGPELHVALLSRGNLSPSA